MPHAHPTCRFHACHEYSLAMDYQESDKQATLKPLVILFLKDGKESRGSLVHF
jgi:hypothetical protein